MNTNPTPERALLYSLLRSALKNEKLSPSVFDGADEEVFARLYSLAYAHDLTHILSNGIAGAANCPAELREKFEKQKMLAVFRVLRLITEEAQIFKVLNTAGIPHIALKGAVVRLLYPEPWMRTASDIDVLVPEDRLEDAVSELTTKLNYSAEKSTGLRDVALISPNGVRLELHFSLLTGLKTPDKTLSRVWQYAEKTAADSSRYQLTNEFFIFHLVAHAAYHIYFAGGCGIKILIDLWIAGCKLDYDEEKLLVLLSESGLESLYSALCQLAELRFSKGNRLNPTAEKLEELIIFGGVYGTAETRAAMGQVRFGGKTKYLLSRVFPSYEFLSRQYPSLKKRKWLTPFYQMRRWGRIVFRGRAGSSLSEVKAVSDLSPKKQKELRALLSELGIGK